MATNGINYSQASGLTISTNNTQRVIVTTGGTSTFTGITYGSKIIESVGTEGNLFSVYDDLTGDILAVTNSAGGTIFAVNAYDPVRISGLTESTTSNSYLVIQPNGVVKYKTSIFGESGLSGLLGSAGASGLSGNSGVRGNDGVSSSIFYYSAKTTTTTGNPSTGYTLWNNVTQTASTQISIHHLTDNLTNNLYTDIDVFLATIGPGQKLIIQDQENSGDYQIWNVTGATTNINPNTSTSYWTVPVSISSSAGVGSTNFANDENIFIAIQGGSSGISGVSGIVGGGLSWTYSTTGQTGIANYGFIATAATTSTITLPATATLGSTVEVTGIGAGAWKIAQLSNHQIHFGIVNSTSGTTGYLQSTQTYDSIRLLCTTANNEYTVLTVMGNITVI